MSSSAPRRVRVGNVLSALLGGFVGVVVGGLVAYLVTNDAAAVWIAAPVVFVVLEASVLFALLKKPGVGRQTRSPVGLGLVRARGSGVRALLLHKCGAL